MHNSSAFVSRDEMSSYPDIPVFTRRQSQDEEASYDQDYEDSNQISGGQISSGQLNIDRLHESRLDDDVSELCTSFVEDVFEPPHSTWWGRLVFGTVSAICVLSLLAIALSHIWAHGQATRLGFVYSQASKENTRLKEEQRLLNLQLAKLRNPMRLARIARQQLGMRLPDRSQVISEEQVSAQLRVQKELPVIGKGIRLASHKRAHLIR